jgi:hypothetical protein
VCWFFLWHKCCTIYDMAFHLNVITTAISVQPTGRLLQAYGR